MEGIEIVGLGDMAVQGYRVELGQNCHAVHTGIDAVADGDVNQPVLAPEGDGWFRANFGQRIQSAPPSPSHNDAQDIIGGWHMASSGMLYLGKQFPVYCISSNGEHGSLYLLLWWLNTCLTMFTSATKTYPMASSASTRKKIKGYFISLLTNKTRPLDAVSQTHESVQAAGDRMITY
jgi:hypothetical protein